MRTTWIIAQVQTALLLMALLGLAASVGFLFAGPLGAMGALGFGAVASWASSRGATQWMLRQLGARPLSPSQAPGLYRRVVALCRRAGLERVPPLYLIHAPLPNALAMGNRDTALIAVTTGLLERLPPDEVTAVLAHELGHVVNDDLAVLGWANGLAQITSTTGSMGLMLAFISAVVGAPHVMIIGLLLGFTPPLANLLFLALSRQREFAADQTAAELTGDPLSLARALERIDRPVRTWRRLLGLHERDEEVYFRTHPPTEERIQRLLAS